MNVERTAAFKRDDLVEELRIEIDKSLESRSVPGQCCIYRVPVTIRRVNEKLYTPQLISIGPLHYGKPELADMEKKKKQYVKRFFQRTTTEKIDETISFIKNNENEIRTCYTEISPLESLEFVRMILYDSIFIIEIFLRGRIENRSDILLDTVPVSYSLGTDLQLFENQLPYFVLDEIYKLAFSGLDVPTFMDLAVDFFGHFMDVKFCPLTPNLGVKHFTDWRRISRLQCHPISDKIVVNDLPCATKLHDSGIKFKCIPEEESLIDIRIERYLIPFLNIHALQIPQLLVSDETECLFLNMIALEQCLYPHDAQFCSYVELLNYLINTKEDVDLLVKNGIISNYMGDNASVAIMFNKLNQLVVARQPSPYHIICRQLKKHYNNPWNRGKAELRRAYFNRGTAGFAALILLRLTIVQTLCSIWQIVQFK